MFWIYLFARLAPGVSIDQAPAALEPVYRGILADVEAPRQTAMSAQTLAQFRERPLQVAPGRLGQSRMSRDVQRVGLLFVLGITGAVLLIACANITNLQLARSAARAGGMAVAALAMLLAAVGLYGVLAYAVALRTRELGLRMALGADARRLRAMVIGQVGRMALAGGAIGLVLALGLGRVLRSVLYEMDRLPPAVIAAAVAGLAAVALAAGFVPARRALPRRPDGGATAQVTGHGPATRGGPSGDRGA